MPFFYIRFVSNIINMKSIILLLTLCLTISAAAQDTFSIVAVDSITGEVGSAGASCLDNIQFPGSNGAVIISDVIPGRGAIHTQAQWNQANQAKARTQLLAGKSPQEVLAFMAIGGNDANFNPSIRQYGIADLSPTGSPRSAGFTGANCMNYKNHITGPGYAIQGNILSGQAILDSMEARYLRTTGPLAVRLMAALQGANVPGADTRCLANGTSSLSAFIRVARPNDGPTPTSFYLNLNVPSLPTGREPIDSLQRLFTVWQQTITSTEIGETSGYTVAPNPASDFCVIAGLSHGTLVSVLNQQMQTMQTVTHDNMATMRLNLTGYPSGLYYVVVNNGKDVEVLKLMLR
jgi:uncharacterized Ntn-hydrolase superfamily protein